MLPEIKIPNGTKIAVIGDIHGHQYQFDQMVDRINPGPNMLLVSLGDLLNKGFGPKAEQHIINKIKAMVECGYGHMIRGNHELKMIQKARQNDTLTSELVWLNKQPLAISFIWENQNRVTVVHGGVLPSHTWEDLDSSLDIAYIRAVDSNGNRISLDAPNSKLYHELYDGRFGFLCSGHNSQKDGMAKFYNFSCNLDSSVYTTGRLTAQIFSESGLEDLIIVDGPINSNKNQ